MNKRVVILVASLGGVCGAYIPVLLGAGGFSSWALLGSFIGGLVGVWVGAKISE